LRAGRKPSRIGLVSVRQQLSGSTRLAGVLVALVGLVPACDMTGGRPVVGGVTLTGVAGAAATGSAGVSGGGTGAAGSEAACGVPLDTETCEQSQPIVTCEVTNARDLGGMPLQPEGTVACGQVFRGPPLSDLSARACAETKRLGIRTIIDLRMAEERYNRPDDSCVGAKMVLAPLPIPYQVSGANYIADFDTKESIARVFRTLADPSAYPVYFHCTYGRDRTGVVAAAILLALGASRADILAEYTLSKATVGAFPASLEALIDEITRRGGIEPSLRAAGVTDADLAALRANVKLP
jgi:protein-tyrosine phosphatase